MSTEDASEILVWKKYAAELIGTFILVIGGVGTAVIAGHQVGELGVALAFGLSLLVLCYAIGPISGCHVNPAVTFGQLVAGRISLPTAVGYWISQFVGGGLGGLVLYGLASSLPTYRRAVEGLGANGWGKHSPSAAVNLETGNLVHGYGLSATVVVEVLLTALLVFVVLAATDRLGHPAAAGVAIGLTLTLIHLIAIPIDNTSVNPARSFAVAPFQNGAMAQLWAFIVFPLIGGGLGAVVYALFYGHRRGVTAERVVIHEPVVAERIVITETQ
ncbi:MAG: AraC family transcriptional regulator [Mycobacteriaceae bacterium]|nr:AraC family transcriptional regulator [Mycobacteriaceae bacterium]